MSELSEKNWTELDKVTDICTKLLNLWFFQVLFFVISIFTIFANPILAIPLAIGIICFLIANVFFSISLFFYGGNDSLVKRQKTILIIVWLIDIFLSLTIIPGLIAKYFFYKGYVEIAQKAGKEVESFKYGKALKVIGIGFLVILLLVAVSGAAYSFK